MTLELYQISFYYLFDVLLLLLFLFGESFLGVYIIGLFALFFLLYSPFLDFSRLRFYRAELGLWLLFLLGLLLSSFFTHSLSLTLNSGLFYLFSFIFFVFFLGVKPQLLNRKFLLYNLLFVLLSLAVVSFGIIFFPGLGEMIPGMNLIYSTFGHNHLGILMVLLMPIVWYLLHENKFERKKFILLTIFLFFLWVNLMLSFGRVVILLGLGQQFLLSQIFYRNFVKHQPIFKMFFFAAVGLVLIGLFLMVNQSWACSWSTYQDQLCKDIKQDLHFSYWQTALVAAKKNLFIGYGPGSYILINERYKLRPDANTSFAHNAFFQVLAEGGIVMGLPFLVLMGYLLWQVLRQTQIARQLRSKEYSLSLFLLLGLVSICIDVWFDFDWSFLGIFCGTLLLVVLVLRDRDKKVAEVSFFHFSNFGQLIFYGAALVIGATAVLSLGVEYHLANQDLNRAAQFFPYFQSHMKIFLQAPDLDEQNRKRIETIYRHFSFNFSGKSGVDTYYVNYQRLADVAPWYGYDSGLLLKLNEQHPDLVKMELQKLVGLFTRAQRHGYRGRVETDHALAILAIQVGDDYLQAEQWESAAQMYKLANKLHLWSINDIKPGYLTLLKTDQQKMAFWPQMADFPSQYFGQYSEQVATDHLLLWRAAIRQNNPELAAKWRVRIKELAPWVLDQAEAAAADQH